MAAERRLWTGPPGAAIRDRLIDELGSAPGCLWIVPTPLAREQLTSRLMFSCPRHGAGGRSPGLLLGGSVADGSARGG